MKIKISRFHREKDPQRADSIFTVEGLDNPTLLQALQQIKEKRDQSLTFSSGCQSAVCGSCGVRVNGKEVLACSYRVKDGDEVEPLKNLDLLKDLVVDAEKPTENWDSLPTATDSSTCINCNLCYSACPVFETNNKFQNPIFMSRIWKKWENIDNKESVISIVQDNGVWDCTLCGLCSDVCPQNVDPKTDILMLQNISGTYGYSNPNPVADFAMDFSFNSF